jgi:hypothetical protein
MDRWQQGPLVVAANVLAENTIRFDFISKEREKERESKRECY